MKLDAPIAAVTVYTESARVTRSGQVDVEPGLVELSLAGLPGTLLAESLRVRGRGTANARLVSAELRKVYYVESQQATAQELTRHLRDLQAKERVLALRSEAEAKGREYVFALLQSSADYLAKSVANGRAKIDRSAAVLEYAQSSLEAANGRITKLEQEREELGRQIEQAERELDSTETASPREGYEALVTLEIGRAGRLEVEMSYLVSGASWVPLYDLRLMEGEGEPRLEVGYLAEVAQRSGEEWPEVDLTLSTARTSGRSSLPKLNPWFIREAIPYPMAPAQAPGLGMAMMRAMAPAPLSAAEAAPEAGAEPPVESMGELVAETSEAGPAITYRVPRQLSVPSDGSPHKATIAHLALTPKLDYVTAPKIAEEVYRRAKATNSSEYILLPGQANVFWGDEFVGRSALKNIAPGQEFELSLGLDERVKVERKPTARSAEKVLLRDVRRSLYGYEIKVSNLTPQPQHIAVRDQIPVSTNERVVVRLDDATPQPGTDRAMGILEWDLQIDPGKEERVVFVFSVEQPRAMRLSGLPG